jgi:hypothetical protein
LYFRDTSNSAGTKGNDMNKRVVRLVAMGVLWLAPARAFGQCKDALCENVQGVLDAAVTDFREFTGKHAVAGPDLSIEGLKVACQMSVWANNVQMYICSGQVAAAGGQEWYRRVLEDLRGLKANWKFQVSSTNEDHFVEAGPAECDIPPDTGPYLGQCPLHLQVVKQGDGTAKLYFWMNSLSSPYLVHQPPDVKPAPKIGSSGCDEFCEGLKKAFAARLNAFDGSSAVVKLEGAKDCTVGDATKGRASETGTEFVCHWEEGSKGSAEIRFRDLIARLKTLAPPDWQVREAAETEERSGAKVTAWTVADPSGKQDVRVYFSGEAVGLHITAWNAQANAEAKPQPQQ